MAATERSNSKTGTAPFRLISTVMAAGVAVAGCQTANPTQIRMETAEAALPVMERITLAASRCWFASADRRFQPYRLAPELNSFSGRPRLLVVPAERPQERPLAVIEAQGTPAVVQAYGPLLSTPAGRQIATDIKRWAGGSTACAAST